MEWFTRLRLNFGGPFLFLLTSTYWTQGFRSLAWMAVSYQLKDELRLSPSLSQFLLSIVFIPWSVKPLYGILSDCVPIQGSRRVSYLIISILLSSAPWLLLGLAGCIRNSYIFLVILLTIQNIGAAMMDVVIDAMVAEAARKERAEFAGDLQSLSWFAMAFGGMVGNMASGFALAILNIWGVFLIFSILPLLQLVACASVDEKSLAGDRDKAFASTVDDRRPLEDNTTRFYVGEDNVQMHGMVEEKETCSILEDNSKREICNVGSEELVNEMTTTKTGHVMGKDNKVVSYEDGGDDDWVEVEGILDGIENSESEDALSTITTKVTNPSDTHNEVEFVKQKGVEHPEEPCINSKNSSAEQEVSDISSVAASLDRTHDHQRDEGLRRRKEASSVENETGDISDEEKPKESSSYGVRKVMRILFETIKQPAILWPMLWFFIAQVAVPNLSSIMFYYQTNVLQLDASFLGIARFASGGSLMLGTFLYNRFLKRIRLRRIFWWVQIVLAMLTLSDVAIISGVSRRLGIPDKLLLLGASALADSINQFKFMPFLVLSGRLCKPGIEGTLFALFMSLNNLGATISSFFGAFITSSLQISSDKFDHLSVAICIQAACTIIPVFFLSLIPSDITGVSTGSLI